MGSKSEKKETAETGFNLLLRPEKRRFINLSIAASSSIIATAVVLTGCSSVPFVEIGSDFNLSSPSGQPQTVEPSTSPSLERKFDTSDGRTPAEGDVDQSLSIFTTPRTNFIETVHERRSDEYGEYVTTKMSYPSIDSVSNKGVSKNNLVSALEFYTDFVSTQALDSIAFDNYENYERWVSEVAPIFISAKFFDEVVNAQKKGSDSAVVFNNHFALRESSVDENVVPVLMRDGGPRVFNKHIWGLRAEPVGGGIYISGQGAATLLTDDQKGIVWDEIMFPGGGAEGLDLYQDGKPQLSQMSFSVALQLVREEDSWKIAGFSNSFAAGPDWFNPDYPAELLQWRDAVK